MALEVPPTVLCWPELLDDPIVPVRHVQGNAASTLVIPGTPPLPGGSPMGAYLLRYAELRPGGRGIDLCASYGGRLPAPLALTCRER